VALRLILWAIVIVSWSHVGTAAEAAGDQSSERAPDFLKVFSGDGGESLTGTCRPKDRPSERIVTEATCRFTHVRFQKPSPSKNLFPSTLEEAVQTDQEIAADFLKNPEKTRTEWDTAMREAGKEMCSTEATRNLHSRIAAFAEGSRRKQLFADLLKACSHGVNDVPSRLWRALSQIEQSTCRAWVDHFSLDFRKIGSGKWLYTQQQPSLAGTLKVYELTAENGYPLWTLTETRVTVGHKEGEAVNPFTERKVWSWKNWNSYEIPGECRFISYDLVQYESE
jgi:hypothetical protein